MSIETNNVTKHCKKHNVDYDTVENKIGTRVICQPCPECCKENAIQSRQGNKDLAEQEQNRLRIRGLNDAMIPQAYRDKQLSDFKADTDDKIKVFKVVSRYSDLITSKTRCSATLILSGSFGTGKTHLACGVALKFAEHGSPYYTTAAKMIRYIRSSYHPNSKMNEQNAIDLFAKKDFLIIDEVGRQKGTDSEQNLISEIINERYSELRPTIIVSNYAMDEIEGYIGAMSIDRIREQGGVLNLGWASYRSKINAERRNDQS